MSAQLQYEKLDSFYSRMNLYYLDDVMLLGSRKQNEWASQIRADFYYAVVGFIKSCRCYDDDGNYKDWVLEHKNECGYTDDMLKTWVEYFERALEQLRLYVEDIIVKHYKSSWWIDNRDVILPQIWVLYKGILNAPESSYHRLKEMHAAAMKANYDSWIPLY